MTGYIWLDISITGAVFTLVLFMWLGKDERCSGNSDDEHSDVDGSGRH